MFSPEKYILYYTTQCLHKLVFYSLCHDSIIFTKRRIQNFWRGKSSEKFIFSRLTVPQIFGNLKSQHFFYPIHMSEGEINIQYPMSPKNTFCTIMSYLSQNLFFYYLIFYSTRQPKYFTICREPKCRSQYWRRSTSWREI